MIPVYWYYESGLPLGAHRHRVTVEIVADASDFEQALAEAMALDLESSPEDD